MAGKPLSALDRAFKGKGDAGPEPLNPAYFPKVDPSNFIAVYRDPGLRREFYGFLTHVYHLYPEARFDALIGECAGTLPGDEAIYREIQSRLPGIKPFLSELSYGLPALRHQKSQMLAQALDLLPKGGALNGYLEIGTQGRYASGLQTALGLKGPMWWMNERPSGFSPMDLAERGQIRRLGEHIPLGNYQPAELAPGSLDLVSNFIGLHHAPLDRLRGFIASLARAIRPGGYFLLRDHHVDSRGRYLMAALAHDVFNVGLGVPWEVNAAERRYFRPLGDVEADLRCHGLVRTGKSLLQEGDPTQNTLILFRKNA